jgi:hypothetical protein
MIIAPGPEPPVLFQRASMAASRSHSYPVGAEPTRTGLSQLPVVPSPNWP